jgi:hypothetical protein
MAMRTLTGAIAKLSCVALIAMIDGGLEVHAVLAQDAGSVKVEVGECVNLPSPEERFACYERQVDAARSAPIPATPAPAAEPASAVVVSSESPGDAAPAAPAVETEPQEFRATVTAVQPTVPNKLEITLDNGQIWRQSYAKYYPLRPGQKVWVRPSRWGGVYWLTAEEMKSYIQVRRVR